MRKTRSHVRIYQKRIHLVVTFLFIIIPFIGLYSLAHVAHIVTQDLFLYVAQSFGRLALAYVIAAALAWIFAIIFFEGKRATVALPIFDVLQSFPTFAVIPLATLFLGVTSTTVVFFLVLTIIWPIFFTILSSLKLAKHDWREAVDIAGLKGFKYIRYYLLPVSSTGFITGSVIGLGEAWEALIATEIIVGLKNGLGGFFETYSHNVPITAFGVIAFLIIIFSINKLLWLPLLEWSHAKLEE